MLPWGVHSCGHRSQGQIKAFELGEETGREDQRMQSRDGEGVGVAPLFWSLPSSPLELIQVYFCARAPPSPNLHSVPICLHSLCTQSLNIGTSQTLMCA